MTTTAVDCFASFAPFLANVICCPQLQATLTILIGQSSKQTGSLALDPTLANYCLSDVQQLLMSQGASDNLHSICSVHLSNATEGSCPVSTVDAFESVVDSSKLLEACRKVDPVNECCSQTCQSAISDAARKISSKDAALTSDTASPKVDSCRNVVLRWLSSRLEPSSATKMLRQISNCNVNGGTYIQTNNLLKCELSSHQSVDFTLLERLHTFMSLSCLFFEKEVIPRPLHQNDACGHLINKQTVQQSL
ncbi:hypothetical protein VPH35_037219 [Triticum aestivum]